MTLFNGYGKMSFLRFKFFAFLIIHVHLLCVTEAFCQYKLIKLNLSSSRFAPNALRIATDSRGFIWYLTYEGLYRYDGNQTEFLQKALTKLGFTVTPHEMLIDEHDRLWLAGQGMFACLDIRTWKLTMAPKEMLKPELANDISIMQGLSNGEVIICYNSGYMLVGNGKIFKSFDAISRQSHKYGYPLFADAIYWRNSYWLSTVTGKLLKQNASNKDDLKSYSILNDNSFISRMVPQATKLVCKSSNGPVYDFDGNKITEEPLNDFSTQSRLNQWHDLMVQVNGDYLYLNRRSPYKKEISILSENGLKKKVLFNDSTNALSEVYVNSMVYNRQNDIIILGTTWGVYLLYKEAPKILQFNPFEKTSNKSVRGIYRFPDGDIFFAGYSGSGLQAKTKAFFSSDRREGYCMIPVDDHRLLVGFEGAFLSYFDKRTLTFQEVTYHMDSRFQNLLSKFVFSLIRIEDKYYIGTTTGVWVMDIRTGELAPLTDRSGKPVTTGLQIKRLILNKRVLYIASHKGFYSWNGERLNLMYPDQQGTSESIYDAVADDKGIWLATLNEGMVRIAFDGKVLKRLNLSNVLNSNTVFSLLKAENTLIAGTDRGLVLIRGDSISLLSEDDGLLQREFNHGAAYYDPVSKTAYLGGLNGYTVLQMNGKSKTTDRIHPIYISTVRLAGKQEQGSDQLFNLAYSNDAKITLQHWQDFLSISVACPLSYMYNYDLEYEIEGLSEAWHPLDKTQQFSLLGMAPGDYTLKIRYTKGRLPGEVLTIGIKKQPSFFQTWQFTVIVLLVLLGFVQLIYRLRINEIRKKQAFRTQISSDLHDEVGSVLTGIALQADFLLYKTDRTEAYLKQIAESSRSAITTMGDIVWSIDSRNDDLPHLIVRMREYLQIMLSPLDIHYDFDAAENTGKLSQLLRQNIYLIFKEAVNNICKHSGADHVKISLNTDSNYLELRVTDNGSGIGARDIQGSGQGLSNMEMRAKRMKGSISFINAYPGTEIILKGPIKKA